MNARNESRPPHDSFRTRIGGITRRLDGRALDAKLESELNDWAAPGGAIYTELLEQCRRGIREGWMCHRDAGGIRFGRVLQPGPDTHDFSVDVVDMANVTGPHHTHPDGEIDLVMPLDDDARFDGRPAGWVVYEAGSAHRPTVTGGRALILYLLPHGAIEFTGAAS